MKVIRTTWSHELGYIIDIRMRRDYGAFNDDPACFQRYLKMQENAALEEGYDAIATAIRQEHDLVGRQQCL